MITPASTFPESTASSISLKTKKTLFVISGKARLNNKCAVVSIPGIATRIVFSSGFPDKLLGSAL